MQVMPYLFFNGRAEEAAEFYKKAVGAEVIALVRFEDSPDPAMVPPGNSDKVMHMALKIGKATVMGSDGDCGGKARFQGFSLSLTAPDEAEAERRFTALSDGGKVEMPLTETFFSPRFGMLTDRFGVGWMVHVTP